MKKYTNNLGTKAIIKDQSLLNHEAIKQQIVVLDELRDLIPPLQDDEQKQLEKNILAEGCREALMLWQTTRNTIDTSGSNENIYVLIDGHNRYGICQKHKIDFKIHLVSFTSLKEAKEYMIDNQLGRRNLIPEQASYLRGLRYNAEKLEKGKYARDEHKGQNVLYGSEVKKEPTSVRLAKQYNVSEKTIKRDAEFAEGLNLLSVELKKDILAGRVKAKKSDIQQLAQITHQAEPINSLEQVAELVKPAGVAQTKLQTDNKQQDRQNLKKQIQDIAQRLSNTESTTLCDELISLSQALKNLLV